MSGGEKARLVLCMMVWQRPNLLLLDEPTNHLDLATREALAMALNEFEGTVMLVSHDRALLRSVCDEFWMVSRGGVEPFDGDLDDYQRYLLDEAKRQREAVKESVKEAAKEAAKALAAPPPVAAATPAPKSKANTSPKLKKELQDLETRIETLQKQISQWETELSNPSPQSDIADLGRKLAAAHPELAQCEERWLELAE